MLKWIITNLLLTLLFLVLFTVFSYTTRGRRPLHNLLAWLLFAFLMPYIAIPLFLIVGQRKLRWIPQKTMTMEKYVSSHPDRHTHSTENLLCNYGVPPATHNNKIVLLDDGVTTYQTLIALFEQAQDSILISTYRVANDPVGNTIIDLLIKKAKLGVHIYLLIDTVGGFLKFPRHKLNQLKKAGGSVRYIMPLFHTPFRGHANLRDHRKIIIVDGIYGITGGMNLGEEYIGPTPSKSRWYDASLLIQGGAVNALRSVFESDWQFAAAHKEIKTYTRPTISTENYGNAALQIVASGPDLGADTLYDAILTEIYNASQSIYIVTPYFVIDEILYKALTIAVQRGVTVNIVLPQRSNHPFADLIRAVDVRRLHEDGVKFWFYTPGMIHAKVVLFDATLAILGSANFDLRSLLVNFEVSCFIYSEPEIQIIHQWLQSILTNCDPHIPSASRLKIMLEYTSQILKPLS